MSAFTMEELAAALKTEGLTVDALDEDQASVKRGACDLAFIDIRDCIIEVGLRVCGNKPGGEIDMAEARKAIEPLREAWEDAGFEVSEHGYKGTYSLLSDKDTKYPDVTYDARHSFASLAEAGRFLASTRDAKQHVSIQAAQDRNKQKPGVDRNMDKDRT